MALTISELDKNFKTETKIEREGLVFYSALYAPFSIHGVLREGNEYNRMPDKIAESVSRAVHRLSKNTAGFFGLKTKGLNSLSVKKSKFMA